MDRLACISIPALPLQLALRRFPQGQSLPVALVKDDRPASPILNLNLAAKKLGLKPGMRYGEALSLVGDLRATVVSNQEVGEARTAIRDILSGWSPDLEDCPFDPGAFWVSTAGLSLLFGEASRWGASVREALAAARFRAFVVVGHTREGTYLLARHLRRSTALPSPAAEAEALLKVPLALLPLSARHRRQLTALGIRTWGALSRLPQAEVARRFGSELLRDLRKIKSLGTVPLQSTEAAQPVVRILKLDYGVVDLTSLQPLLEGPLGAGLGDLESRGQLLGELTLELLLENGTLVSETLRPSRPTTDSRTWSRLIGLRLSGLVLAAGTVELRLRFQDVPGAPASGDLFAPPVVRDLVKGEEALALIRALLGNGAVLRPGLGNSHLPGGSYTWTPAEGLRPARPGPPGPGGLVRRISFEPGASLSATTGKRIAGPFHLLLSVGTQTVDREYWFLANTRQEVHWVYWDRREQRSGWEGVVD